MRVANSTTISERQVSVWTCRSARQPLADCNGPPPTLSRGIRVTADSLDLPPEPRHPHTACDRVEKSAPRHWATDEGGKAAAPESARPFPVAVSLRASLNGF